MKRINLNQKQETDVCKLFDAKISISEISKITNISREVVNRVLREHGKITPFSTKKEDLYKKTLLPEFLNGKSLTQIAKEYKVCRGTLALRLKQDGYQIINHQNETKFNENIFDSIDTEEKAYWLGFLFADGALSLSKSNTSKPRYCLELSLQLSDIVHLDKFNHFMQHNKNNIKYDSYRCRWMISNKHLWETLNSYGCTPQKSLTLKFPKLEIFKDKSLIRHFIRGYFDGDGCISRHVHSKSVSLNVSVIGTPEFLNELEINGGFSKNSLRRIKDYRRSSQTIDLSFKKSEAIQFLNFLYKDSTIYLDRKYKLYQFFKDTGSRSKEEFLELLSGNIGESLEIDNTEINSEITKGSESLYSVESE